MTIENLVEAWRVNNEINLDLLAGCDDDTFDFKPGKGKTIRSNFVHIIGFRRAWLEEKMKTEAATIPKLDWQTATREELVDGLRVSSPHMEELFRNLDARPRPGKWEVVKFFAYCIAHEANHRAQVELALRLNGREPDNAFLYGLWDWGKR